MDARGESELQLAEALRARATGAGGAQPGPMPSDPPRGAGGWPVSIALLVALLAGAVLGTGLALLSVLVPGLLPALG